MSPFSAIRICDNLASREPGVTMRATDNKTAGGINEISSLRCQIFAWYFFSDNFINDRRFNLAVLHLRFMLGRYNHGINTHWTIILIQHGNLRFAIGPQKRHGAVATRRSKCPGQAMGIHNRHGH